MQTDRLGNSTGGMLSVTLFLVAINGILGELGNGVTRSLFPDNLAIYITTRSRRVASRALQGVPSKESTQFLGITLDRNILRANY